MNPFGNLSGHVVKAREVSCETQGDIELCIRLVYGFEVQIILYLLLSSDQCFTPISTVNCVGLRLIPWCSRRRVVAIKKMKFRAAEGFQPGGPKRERRTAEREED